MALKNWSTDSSSNVSGLTGINWNEGMNAASVNDSARATMAQLAVWRDQIKGGTVYPASVGGTANAITITCSPTVDAYAAGQRFEFKAGSSNTGAATLNVDSLGAKAIKFGGADVLSGAIASGDIVLVAYDGTYFQLISNQRASYSPKEFRSSQYATLADADTAAASASGAISLDSAVTLAADTTIASPIIYRGGSVDLGNYNLTLSDSFIGPNVNIFSLSGTGVVVFSSSQDVIKAKWLGLVGDGSTDDTNVVKAAEAAAHACGAKLDFHGCNQIKFTSLLEFKCGSHDIDFAGPQVKFKASSSSTNFTTGKAIRFKPYSASTLDGSSLPKIGSLWLEGPGSSNSNLDGVAFEGSSTSGQFAYTAFDNLFVRGFRDNYYWGDYTYLLGYKNLRSRKAWRRGWNFDLQTTAGENINIHGGVLADGTNQSTSAVGLYAAPGCNATINLFGVSSDYNNIEFDVTNAQVKYFGCHFENNSAAAMGKVKSPIGTVRGTVKIIGGEIAPTGTPNRDHLFEVYGGNATMDIDADLYLQGFKYQLVKDMTNTSTSYSGTPRIKVRGEPTITVSSTADTFPNISDATNRIYNGDAELNATTGWTTSLQSGATFAASSADPQSGAYNFALGGTGTAGISEAYQDIDAKPGDIVMASLWYKGTITAGTFEPQIAFKDGAGNTIPVSGLNMRIGGLNMSATVSTYSRTGGQFVCPAGCSKVRVRLLSSGLNGSIKIDNVRAHTV